MGQEEKSQEPYECEEKNVSPKKEWHEFDKHPKLIELPQFQQ